MVRLDFDGRFVSEWKNLVESHLGRTLGSRGLSAGDFGTQAVEVVWPDRSVMRFQYAFVVVDHARGKFALFTEHCGYWEMPCEGFVVTVHHIEYIDMENR